MRVRRCRGARGARNDRRHCARPTGALTYKDGALTYKGCFANLGANGCADPRHDSLGGASGVAVSPEGKSVYVASYVDDSVTTFDRTP